MKTIVKAVSAAKSKCRQVAERSNRRAIDCINRSFLNNIIPPNRSHAVPKLSGLPVHESEWERAGSSAFGLTRPVQIAHAKFTTEQSAMKTAIAQVICGMP